MTHRDEAEEPEATLRLIYRAFDGFDRAFGEQIAAFRRDHPEVAFALESLDVPPLHEKMIAQGGCRSGNHDLFLAVTDWLPELIRDGYLRPLSDFLVGDPPPDWPDGWPATLLDLQTGPDGTGYGLPYHNGPEVFMYRTDLFEDERERAAFRRQHGRELAPPRTWGEFLEIARFFTRPDDDLYGCVVAAKPDGHNDVYDFLIHLWSRGGEFLAAAGRPAFAGPEGEAALRYYVDLIHEHRVTQPAPWEYDSVASGEFYASGRAAMMWNWAGFQTVADLPSSAIAGKTRATMLPGGDSPNGRAVSLIVYWVLTIPVGCRRPDLAWSFLRHVATPAMDKVTALSGGSGVRFSTWNDPEIRQRFGYYQVIEEVHRHVRTLPRLPQWQEICGSLDRMMDSVVTSGDTVPAALHDAALEVESILGESGGRR